MKKWLFPLCAALLLAVTACAPGAVSKESPPPISRPADTASPTPVPTEVVSVRTDWSKLGEKPEPLPEIKTRRYEEYTDTLIPRDDYGTLIPYAGLRLADNWPATTGCLYGLMTKDGTIVIDPVFSNVYRPSYYDGTDRAYHPLLVLSKGGEAQNLAIAAVDGSWHTDFMYSGIKSYFNGLLLLQPDSLTLMNPDGTVRHCYSLEELGLTEEEFKALRSDVDWFEGVGGEWVGDYISLIWADEAATSVRLIQTSTGQQVTMSYQDWDNYCLERQPTDKAPPAATWDESVFAQYPGMSRVYDNFLGYTAPCLLEGQLDDEDYTVADYYRTDGVLLLHQRRIFNAGWYQQTQLIGGLLEVLDLNMASYYDINTMKCVFRTYLGVDGT